MKILLHSYAFSPLIGGIETVSDRLALGLTALGHDVTLVTETPGEDEHRGYQLVRCPSLPQRLSLISKSDIVLANGASLRCALPALLLWKPFAWIHQGYQTRCIDGLGWWDSVSAPLTPLASILFHLKRSGALSTLTKTPQLIMRIVIARFYAHNIVVSECVSRHIPFPRKTLIANPHPLEIFEQAASKKERITDFIFVGRLVSEKGCDFVIRAMHLLRLEGYDYSLKIVGNGEQEKLLRALVTELSLSSQISFVSSLKGAELARSMAQCWVGLVPSQWAEPYGGVAVELMAAGLPVITTEDSGPEDKVDQVGAVVPKGNVKALAEAMKQTLELSKSQPENVSNKLKKQLIGLSEAILIEKHGQLLKSIRGRMPLDLS
jgi:glycosyltransferase involved in cell wall biosynthesis